MSEGARDEPRTKYDLEERTARFGEAAIAFVKRLPVTAVTDCLIARTLWQEAKELHLIFSAIHRGKRDP